MEVVVVLIVGKNGSCPTLCLVVVVVVVVVVC